MKLGDRTEAVCWFSCSHKYDVTMMQVTPRVQHKNVILLL